jgi:hypothetical protein
MPSSFAVESSVFLSAAAASAFRFSSPPVLALAITSEVAFEDAMRSFATA